MESGSSESSHVSLAEEKDLLREITRMLVESMTAPIPESLFPHPMVFRHKEDMMHNTTTKITTRERLNLACLPLCFISYLTFTTFPTYLPSALMK